ncbi:helix-turn-helix transcriptional regulator [Neobittarella massiliensis]|uniref:Helix-turn-helix transcriptional regulator n=1 Tax=Neobittarella massiliensis (ex Bilen et al. 2018) TaxID=2041842 RepID=A0A8J6IKX9_9FIRM|nr:helix-turn-helix transcriptional regulator [Neobittarella massiliensis]
MSDKIYAQIIVDRIVSLCKQRKISIYKLAEMSGITQSTLDNLIGGHTFNPKIRTLHKVANAFNMTVAEFLNFPALNNYSFEDDSDE